MQVIGFIQPQYEYNFLETSLTGKNQDESSFYFNRARLGVTGNTPYDFSYYFLMEFSPTLNGARESRAPFLLDAFVSYNRFAPYAKISLGQFKSPFGLEALTACHKLYTINRSDVAIQTQGLFRDQGIMLFSILALSSCRQDGGAFALSVEEAHALALSTDYKIAN